LEKGASSSPAAFSRRDRLHVVRANGDNADGDKGYLVLQPDRSTDELNERQVVPCGLLVPGRDRSKALDVVEKDFDDVASSVEARARRCFCFRSGLEWMTGFVPLSRTAWTNSFEP